MSVTSPVHVPTPMPMVVVMVMPGMVVLFHWPNLTSVARPYQQQNRGDSVHPFCESTRDVSGTQEGGLRIGGMITWGALHAPRMVSAEQARGLRSRSKQMRTSRSLGALWPVQVTTIDRAGRRGLALPGARVGSRGRRACRARRPVLRGSAPGRAGTPGAWVRCPRPRRAA